MEKKDLKFHQIWINQQKIIIKLVHYFALIPTESLSVNCNCFPCVEF